MSARLAERVRLRLTGRCEYSREDHAGLLAVRYDTVVVLPYVGRDTIAVRDTFGQAMVLEGAAWRAAPEVEVRVAGPLWLTVGLEYRAGRYSAEDSARGRELDAARYLDESHDRLEPGIGIRLDGSRGQARLTGAYLYEHVIESNAWSTASSRGGRVEGEVLWSIFPWLSVSLLGEYQVRRFLDRTDHYGINGYLSVSLSALLPGR